MKRAWRKRNSILHRASFQERRQKKGERERRLKRRSVMIDGLRDEARREAFTGP